MKNFRVIVILCDLSFVQVWSDWGRLLPIRNIETVAIAVNVNPEFSPLAGLEINSASNLF